MMKALKVRQSELAVVLGWKRAKLSRVLTGGGSARKADVELPMLRNAVNSVLAGRAVVAAGGQRCRR
jgi:hypothetical protein